MSRRAIAALMVAGVVLSVASCAVTPAHADELSFSVSAEGVTLPAGQTFPDGGHVNIHASQPHTDLHFEAKCITRVDAECAGALHDAAQYIGTSFIPWSAFGLTGSFCIPWVQVAGIDKHFGDAGEAPICAGGTPSTTSPLPSSTPTPSPTSTPGPTSSPSSEPPATGVSSPPKSGQPAAASTDPTSPTTSPSLTSATAAPDRLADTGTDAVPVFVAGAVLLLAYGGTILWCRRRGFEEGGGRS